MTPNILLLDCSSTLREGLERKGFSVKTGTIGFCGGFRQLPSQIYESEVIVYNPISLARKSNEAGFVSILASEDIKDHTPEYSLSHLKDHILKGATMLVFINHFGGGTDHNSVYDWIPFMPKVVPNKDQRVIQHSFTHWHKSYLELGFLDINELVTPVRFKLKGRQALEDGSDEIIESSEAFIEVVPLLYNQNDECLGVSCRFGKGFFYVLPTFKSNDEVISTFLNKVIPEIYGIETRWNLIDDFISPEQKSVETRIEKMAAAQQEAEKHLENAKEDLVQAKLVKAKTIHEDETAVLILNYYDLARQQADVALFFLYKVTEALGKKYGNEVEAKKI